MSAFNKAWKVLKDDRTSSCEGCGTSITFDEIGGFDDAGPLCKRCHYQKTFKKSEGYDGESAESECAICGKRNTGGTPDVVRPSGSGMHVCTRPNMEDYLPGDGEGYAGHMLQYQQCQRQARGE